MTVAWQRLVALAAQQHRVVARRQLEHHGISPELVPGWVAAGRLFMLHRGVYAVGRRDLSAEGRWLAAVLAAGPGACLSHLSAAALWGLIDRDPVVIDVSCRSQRSRRPGIRTHSSRTLSPADVRLHRSVPVTSPSRTFLDIAGVVGERRLRNALRFAEREGLFDGAVLLSSMPPLRGCPGAAAGRRMLQRYAGLAGRFRSGLEMDFWELLQTGRPRPLPEVNVRVGGYETDFVWRDLVLIVEIDGDRSHRTSVGRVTDAERDRVHRALGYEVLRYDEADVRKRPEETLASLDLAIAWDRTTSPIHGEAGSVEGCR